MLGTKIGRANQGTSGAMVWCPVSVFSDVRHFVDAHFLALMRYATPSGACPSNSGCDPQVIFFSPSRLLWALSGALNRGN